MHLFMHWLLHFQISLKNNFCIIRKASWLLPACCLARSTWCACCWTCAKRRLAWYLRSKSKHGNWTACSTNNWSWSRCVIIWMLIKLTSSSSNLFTVIWIFSETLRHVLACYRAYGGHIVGYIGSWPYTKPLLRVHAWTDRFFSRIAPCTICMSFRYIQWQLVRIKRKMIDGLKLRPKL